MPTKSHAVICAFVFLTVSSTVTSAVETKVANVAEFDAAVEVAKPGDVIVLADGDWRDADLAFVGQGEEPEDRRITLRAATPGKAVLTGTSRLRIGGRFLTIEGLLWRNTAAKDQAIAFRRDSKTLAEDCTVRECAIIDDAPVAGGGDRKWVSLYGRRNRVERCRFDGKQSAGTLLVVWIPDDAPLETQSPAEASLVQHVIYQNFFGRRDKLGKNGGEIIRVGDSKTSLRRCDSHVTGNYFYRCDGEAEIISNKSCRNYYAGNAFIGCSGALTLRHGNECYVGINQFDGDGRKGTGGIRVIGERHRLHVNTFRNLTGDDARAAICVMNGIPDSPADGYAQVRKLKLEANRFIDCKQPILIGFADKNRKTQTLPPDDVSIAETSAVSAQAPIFTIVTPPTNLSCRDNWFLGKLGLSSAAASGWSEQDRDFFKEVFDPPVDHVIATLQTSGPAWLRPTEDFLPKAAAQQSQK